MLQPPYQNMFVCKFFRIILNFQYSQIRERFERNMFSIRPMQPIHFQSKLNVQVLDIFGGAMHDQKLAHFKKKFR